MSNTLVKTYKKDGRVVEIHYDSGAQDPRKAFDNYSEAEVQAWRAGEVYGFVAYTPETCPTCKQGVHKDEDDCWGFYGDWKKSGILEDAGIKNEDEWEEVS